MSNYRESQLRSLMEATDKLLTLSPHYLHYEQEDQSLETRCVFCGSFIHKPECRWVALYDLHDEISKDLEGSWRT